MLIICDGLKFCRDCTQVSVNGPHGLDITPEQLKQTEEGLNALGPHVVPDFDSETGRGLHEFSRVTCDACGSHLAGYRASFAILGELERYGFNQGQPRCLHVDHGKQCSRLAFFGNPA